MKVTGIMGKERKLKLLRASQEGHLLPEELVGGGVTLQKQGDIYVRKANGAQLTQGEVDALKEKIPYGMELNNMEENELSILFIDFQEMMKLATSI